MSKYLQLAASLIIVLLAACSKQPVQEDRIMVTIEPQRYFAEQLVDSLFSIVTLVPSGNNPESYDPTPRQMTQLAKSKAYFCIGHIGFENTWLHRLKSNNPNLLFFDNSQGIDLITGHPHEEPTHSQSNAHIDPHTWSSPHEARIIAQNMCDALIAIDPEHSETYRTNLERLMATIDETDRTIRAHLENSPQRSFIIYHPALSYFARTYGLTQHAIETEGKEPSPEQIKQLVDCAKKESIRTVFIQQEFDRKNAAIIARETNCRLEVINPLSYHWNEEIIRIAKTLSDE